MEVDEMAPDRRRPGRDLLPPSSSPTVPSAADDSCGAETTFKKMAPNRRRPSRDLLHPSPSPTVPPAAGDSCDAATTTSCKKPSTEMAPDTRRRVIPPSLPRAPPVDSTAATAQLDEENFRQQLDVENFRQQSSKAMPYCSTMMPKILQFSA